jgi:hypothetical protein
MTNSSLLQNPYFFNSILAACYTSLFEDLLSENNLDTEEP